MNTKINLVIALGITFQLWGQAPPNNGTNQGQTSVDFWSRAGNSGGSNNFLINQFRNRG